MRRKITLFIQQETVLIIASLLALISCFFVVPDKQYIDYFDWKTLILLFCLMAVMAGLKELGVFRRVGEALLNRVHSQRGVAAVLIMLCFLGSMFITNDVALITFIPFGILVLKMADMDTTVCLTITLMTIAANLGSMLTPIGNPQNLYLFSVSGMDVKSFIQVILPYTLFAAVLLIILTIFGYKRKDKVSYTTKVHVSVHTGKMLYYGILFLLCLTCVMGWISSYVLLAIIIIGIFIENRGLFLKIDYALLATFIAFFLFIGNMGRLPAFRMFISQVVNGREELVGIIASQVISNVPAALLLSGFSHQWNGLIIGTNLGGLGTLIASMASLISYKHIVVQYPEKKTRYLILFTVLNFVFLIILYLSGKMFVAGS